MAASSSGVLAGRFAEKHPHNTIATVENNTNAVKRRD
jgi:hypothetical protein